MSLKLDGPLLIAGAGKMGGALIEGLLARGLPAHQIIIQDPAPPPEIAQFLQKHAIRTEATITSLAAPPSLILMAVKPQLMDQVFAPLAKLAGPKTVVLSIAAGKTLASFEHHLMPGIAVIRAMPNTPAQVGRGVTACVANSAASADQKAMASALLSAVGEVVWLEREDDMDAVTAVSGSGPAYVFLVAECLAEAGRKVGLSPELAQSLARATVAGAGELLHRSDLDAATLRQNVTSPGGTTAAALAVLMGQPGLQDLMTDAVAAAVRRSGELSK
ncbi:MAG: pyrroline-5-carboxylate reductase [Hyphomicrobium sp.]|nr:pyrroline-5-carboxylate reductase [Hyphomicrobium sp.]